MPEILTDPAAIAAAVAARKNGEGVRESMIREAHSDGGLHEVSRDTTAVPAKLSPQEYRFVRPLGGNADDALLDTIRNPEGRFMFGLPELDTRIRGVGPGEMALVVGFSHSGKTQLFLQSVLNNRGRPVLLFTPDETSELILMKLVCMLHGLDADSLERRLKNGEAEAERLVRQAARQHFKNLLVIDEVLGIESMSEALKEARSYWGEEPAGVGYDYLNMLPGFDSIEPKAEALKQWCKVERVPLVTVHQAGRGAAGRGEPITMTSGKFGGEQEANFLIGVRRKRDDEKLDFYERTVTHLNTVSLSVVKNKRPPSKRTPEEGIDHYLCPTSGQIRPLRDEDFPALRRNPVAQSVAPVIPGQVQLIQ